VKTLFLFRHAKSSWAEQGLQDIDRGLNARGIRDAYDTALWLKQKGVSTECMVSSPADRALHTATIISRTLGIPFSTLQLDAKLYEAHPSDIEEVVCALPKLIDTAMLFGHNPGMPLFVNQCVQERIDHFPTSSVACIRFDSASWIDRNGPAELLFMSAPKLR
jgi:phosphohistidine phosphatase